MEIINKKYPKWLYRKKCCSSIDFTTSPQKTFSRLGTHHYGVCSKCGTGVVKTTADDITEAFHIVADFDEFIEYVNRTLI